MWCHTEVSAYAAAYAAAYANAEHFRLRLQWEGARPQC